MSTHQHTPVSASVIKSTSRFAPKAVPRKKQSTNVPPPRPTPAQTAVEENDQDRDGGQDDEAESHIDPSLQVTQPTPRASQRRVGPVDETLAPTSVGIPTLEPSISSSGITPRSTQPTSSAAPARVLRSSGPVSRPTQPQLVQPAKPTSPTTVTTTTTTSRKRRPTTTSVSESSPRRNRRKTTPPSA